MNVCRLVNELLIRRVLDHRNNDFCCRFLGRLRQGQFYCGLAGNGSVFFPKLFLLFASLLLALAALPSLMAPPFSFPPILFLSLLALLPPPFAVLLFFAPKH